ncbi:MAG TPA: hypothetical protein VGP95_08035 [Gemmatimonadaceae bacterium]|nr:hypothetical protein [Gemmatimonadaceae bacterium]
MPPDSTPEFVAEMEQRGFVRIVPVPVQALQLHTYHGVTYDVGAVYDCDEQDVETVEAQGKAVRVKRPGKPTVDADHGAYKTTTVGAVRTTDLATASPKKK